MQHRRKETTYLKESLVFKSFRFSKKSFNEKIFYIVERNYYKKFKKSSLLYTLEINLRLFFTKELILINILFYSSFIIIIFFIEPMKLLCDR